MGTSNTHHIQVVLTEDKNLKEALSDIDVSTIVLFDKEGTLVKCPPCLGDHYTIPNFVQVIDSEAFYNCSNLKRVHIPDSVQKIDLNDQSGSFANCTAFITVDSNNPKYKSVDGKIYEK